MTAPTPTADFAPARPVAPASPARTVVVLGATGTLGRRVVDALLVRGHAVRAASRHPEGRWTRRRGVTPMAADARDAAALDRAVEGADAVVVTLGAGRKGGVRAAGTAAVMAAMKRKGVRRLICLSTLGAGDSRANLNFFWRRVMFGLLLRPAYQDHQAQEAAVRASGLDWTLVRPAAFTDGPAAGRYRHGFGPDATGLALSVSRADIADFIADQVTDDAYLHAAPGVSD